MTETSPELQESQKLEKGLGLGMVIAIGVGGTIGASIFTIIGFAADMAGPAMVISLIIGGILTILIGLNYSELSSTFPESGGGYTFTKKAFGGLPAFLTGWLMSFANIVFGSLAALGFANLIGFPFGFSRSVRIVLALAVLAFFAFLNFRGVEESGKAQLYLVLMLLIGFIIFIGLGIFHVQPSNYQNFMPRGWNGIIQATAFIYVSYFGFETIATVSGETKDPGRNLVIGTIVAVLICMVVYVAVGGVAVGIVNWWRLGESTSPLMLVGQEGLGQPGQILILVLGSIGTLSSVNTGIIASTRVLYALSRDESLPESLSKTNEKNVPFLAVITATILMALFVLSGVIDFIAHVADFNLLLALTFVNLSVYFLRRKRGVLERPFRTHSIIAIVGSSLMLILIPFLDLSAIGVGSVLVLVGLLIYVVKIAPSTSKDLIISGGSTGAALLLFSSLWIGNWNITLQVWSFTLNMIPLLLIGSTVQFIVALVCAFPLGKILNIGERGMVESAPTQRVKIASILKNILTVAILGFAILSGAMFYATFYRILVLPLFPSYFEAYRLLLYIVFGSFAFTATVSGGFLLQRKYLSRE